MAHRTTLWSTAALLGIVVTAVVAWSASQLAGQRIGLASDALSVARDLQPRQAASRQLLTIKHPGRHRARMPAARRPAPVQVSPGASGASTAAASSSGSVASAAVPAGPAPPTASTTAQPAVSSAPASTPSQGYDDNRSGSADSLGKSSHRDD